MMKSAIYMILLLNLYLMATAYPKRSVESSVSRFKRSGVKADLTVDVNGKRVIDVSHPKNNPLISNLQSRGRGITLKFGFILKWPTKNDTLEDVLLFFSNISSDIS